MSADDKQIAGTHYCRLIVTPWDALQSWLTPDEFVAYLKGNAVKYLCRAGKKTPDAREDIRKAIHYLEKLLEVLDLGPPPNTP